MPILGKKQQGERPRGDTENTRLPQHSLPAPPEDHIQSRPPLSSHPIPPRSELTFHCQLSHGSPTKEIHNFSNVKELYVRIGDAFDIDPNTIIFCTLNTHKVDMTRLLGGQIGLDDFIFAHVRGEAKTVTMTKQEVSMGLTITDNGDGCAFIKKIRDGSIAAELNSISVGDMVAAIDGRGLVGCKHFEVAKLLKEIPRYSTFTLELLEPQKPFAIAPRTTTSKSNRPLSQLLEDSSTHLEATGGRGTLRLKSDGAATVEENVTPSTSQIIERIDDQLESFMGIRDSQLSRLILDMSQGVASLDQFTARLGEGELREFMFPLEFMGDLWSVVNDS